MLAGGAQDRMSDEPDTRPLQDWRSRARAQALYEQVIAHPAERDALLAAEPDAEVRAEAEAMLADDERKPVAAEPGDARIGQRIGAYRLIERIGAGGMGAVYRAQRDDDEFDHDVAIKLLRHHGPASPGAIARFRDERQILAALSHPNIVRLLDGGTTDAGLPYLVMEHVQGVAITTYARDHALSVRARVSLFRDVCAAVQFAHGRLIVHRDLKPSNILVTTSGEPKLLDFGIAKLIDPEATREAHTRTGAVLLTPVYASPEQARNEPITVASDVYSLGAVLYELLCGRPPHEAKDNPLELLRDISEREPPRPSTLGGRELAGDLDTILATALHKDPSLRYTSAEHLSDDLGRYLDGAPVLARNATFAYRASKLVRRHWGKLAIAATVTTALASTTVISVIQANRAEREAAHAARRFEQVRALASSMLFDVDERLQGVQGTTEVRQVIVTRALAYLDELAAEEDQDPQLARELALAYIKVGDIQGNSYEANLGQPNKGLASYHKAAEILDRALAHAPNDLELRRAKVTATLGAGTLEYSVGEFTRAHATLSAGLDAYAALGVEPRYDRYVFRAYLGLVFREHALEGGGEVDMWRDRMDVQLRRWHEAHPTADTRYALAVMSGLRSDHLLMDADPAAACAELDLARTDLARLEQEFPHDVRFTRELAYNAILGAACRASTGNTVMWSPNIGDLAGAEKLLREARARSERLIASDAGDVRHVMMLSTLESQLALVVVERDPQQASELVDAASRHYLSLPAEIQAADVDRWFAYCPASDVLARAGRADDARTFARTGLDSAHAVATKPDALFEDRLHLAMCRYYVARADRTLGDASAARALLEQTARELDALRAERPRHAHTYVGLAATLHLLAELDPAGACALRTRASEVWRAWPGPSTSYVQAQRTPTAPCADATPK
jgi:non-specific serine/threonine protein kinase/serine/threonine-protein kinase